MALVAPSPSDLLAIGQAEAQYRRPDLGFAEGDVTVADLHAAMAMADAVLKMGAQWFKNTFIDGAEKDALRALVNDHMNLQAQPATAAQVTLDWNRTSAGPSGTIPAGTPVASQPGVNGAVVVFTTDADISVPAGSNGPFEVAATAQATGPSGNVPAGTLTQVASSLFDLTFTVTNLLPAGGGNDAEDDDDLRERARSFWQVLARGTLAALEFGAKTVPTVRIATATEDVTTGFVSLIVTDADGNSSLQMVADVTVALEDWRAAGVLVQVVGGAHLVVDLALGLVCRVGFDVAAAGQTLIDAAVARVGRLQAAQKLYLDMVVAAVVSQYPDDVLDVVFLTAVVGGVTQTTIPDPIVPARGQVIRAGTITVAPVAG